MFDKVKQLAEKFWYALLLFAAGAGGIPIGLAINDAEQSNRRNATELVREALKDADADTLKRLRMLADAYEVSRCRAHKEMELGKSSMTMMKTQ